MAARHYVLVLLLVVLVVVVLLLGLGRVLFLLLAPVLKAMG
jgi:hypothetical protein